MNLHDTINEARRYVETGQKDEAIKFLHAAQVLSAAYIHVSEIFNAKNPTRPIQKFNQGDDCLFKLNVQMKELTGKIVKVNYHGNEPLSYDIKILANAEEGEIATLDAVSGGYLFSTVGL